MPFTPPHFNLLFNFWAPGSLPSGGPALASYYGQLYLYSRSAADSLPGDNLRFPPSLWIRVSTATIVDISPDIVGSYWSFTDTVPVTRYYRVRWWEWAHLHFPNQYGMLNVDQVNAAGVVPDPLR